MYWVLVIYPLTKGLKRCWKREIKETVPRNLGFPGGASGKESTCQGRICRDAGLIPGMGRSPGVRNGNPCQYSCLENSMDRGTLQATVHRATKSQTLIWVTKHTHTHPETQISVGKECVNSHTRRESCLGNWMRPPCSKQSVLVCIPGTH